MMHDDRLNENVELAESLSAWPQWFAEEAQRLQPLLPSAVIEHFGSTAITGLEAKPIIDVLIGVAAADELQAAADALSSLGYEHLGDGGVPGTQFLVLRADRSFNARITVIAGEVWAAALLLRDYLRSSPQARRTYATAKRTLIADGFTRALDYGDAKAATDDRLLLEARPWRSAAR